MDIVMWVLIAINSLSVLISFISTIFGKKGTPNNIDWKGIFDKVIEGMPKVAEAVRGVTKIIEDNKTDSVGGNNGRTIR